MREIGRRLFGWEDAFEMAFKPEVEACLMVHPHDDPFDLDWLTKEPYEAIVAAAKHVGDTGFVLTDLSGIFSDDPGRHFYTQFFVRPPSSTNYSEGILDIEVDGQKVAEYWWCEFPTFDDFCDIRGQLGAVDTAVYSINAHWGVYTLYEWWHLVGGNLDFIRHVDKMYPAWRNDIITLVDEWEGAMARGHPTVDLLIKLLNYWKKWPGDEWVETLAARINIKMTGDL